MRRIPLQGHRRPQRARASTVGTATMDHDAGKKMNRRKVFDVVDTLGLLVAVVTLAAASRAEQGRDAQVKAARS